MSTIALVWRTSSYSGTNGGQCVQVAFGEQSVFISDSKYVGDVNQQPMITLSAVQWNAVLDLALSAQSGSVDTLTVDLHQDGRADLIGDNRSGDVIKLQYTTKEWDAFMKGVADGEFAQP